MFSGSIPALVTPFAADGRFDEGVYRDFIEWQIAEGSSALVPVGTTGEAATLSAEEHFYIVAVCVDQTKGRVPVIAGAGSNDTRVAIHNIKAAKAAGADAALMVPPYYNRPNQEGIFRHFEAVAGSCDLPIVLYNVPGRTVTDIAVETVARIAHAMPSVIGIKDATGDLSRASWMHANITGQFDLISGDDPSYLGYHAQGGVGVISVTSNVHPEGMVALHEAAAAGDYATARDWQDRLIGLHKGLFLDNSPSPTKYALSRLQLCTEEVRLPLAPTAEAVKPAIDRAMAEAGVG